MPNRFAAWLMPTDSANRNASSLKSSVYCRFGTDSFAILLSVHQNIIKFLMYVETGQVQPYDCPQVGWIGTSWRSVKNSHDL